MAPFEGKGQYVRACGRVQGHAVCRAMRVAGGTPPRGGREVSRFPLRSRAMLFEGGGGARGAVHIRERYAFSDEGIREGGARSSRTIRGKIFSPETPSD